MAATAIHRLTLNPMGKCSNAFFSETTNMIKARWLLCEFPIGCYVKLSTAVQPSWSEGGTTRHKIGSAVSEEKI
jgi:hypothetical protein